MGPERDSVIIDAHMHLWDVLDGRMGRQKVLPIGNGMIRIGRQAVQGIPYWMTDCRNRAELALAAFNEAGVDAAVVTQEYLDGNQNRYLLRVKEKYPRRFFVHGLIDFTRPEQLASQFRQVVKQGFKGIKYPEISLPRGRNAFRLDAPEVMAVWEEMQARRIVLSIDLVAGDVQVPEMKNVLKAFPKLKVAIGHFGMVTQGNWMAQIRLANHENVHIDSGGMVWLFRHEGPPFKSAQAKVKQAVRAVGAEKIMWGSDYPRTMCDFTYRQSLDWLRDGCEFLSAK